jgi:hypothetical protein
MREEDDDQRPIDERLGDYDLSAVIGRRASDYRLAGRRPIGPAGGRRLPPGGGFTPPPGAPPRGQPFRASRDLAARREAYYGRAAGALEGTATAPGPPMEATPAAASEAPSERWVPAPDPVVPGERRYHDGQKVRHRIFGEGQVVSSKLTRSDEEVTVAFPGQGVKKLMASLAGLEVTT